VSYESYEPYEEYDPNQQGGYPEQRQPYYGDQQYEGQYEQPYQEQPYPQQPYPEQQPYPGQQYEEQHYQAEYREQSYQDPQYQEQPPQFQDPQWAQSGLGWERQAWDEAWLGVSPLQQPAREQEYPQAEQGYGAGPYTQVNELSGTDFQQFKADLPRDLPVPDYPPEYDRYEEYGEYREHEYGDSPGFPHQRGDEDEAGDRESFADDRSSRSARSVRSTASADSRDERSTERSDKEKAADERSAAAASAPGRGAFGAAGIGVLAAVAAIASSGALLVVVALIQAAVAFGWQQAVGIRHGGRLDRRAMVLTTLIGWVATVAVYRLSVNSDFLGIPVTLGVGFLLLAADQTIRQGRELGDGESVAGLGIAIAGALFAVLPAGFVVSERIDSDLTAACASAAALGVLCCALLGRNPLRGIFVGLVLGAVVGGYAAKALQANGGLEAGALGGSVAALAAATAVGALDRVVAEAEVRGSTRVVSQVLPVALAAVGALIASAVFR
jgi:hypothetical protein